MAADILALHVISDGIIALSYLTIPITLVYFVRRRADLHFDWIVLCFAAFIIACAGTHLMEIWTIWHPVYWFSGLIKAITAIASVATAILLVKMLPDALRLPSLTALRSANWQLEREAVNRAQSEETLRRVNAELEGRVAERTRQLVAANLTLTDDNARFALAADVAGLGSWELDIAARSLKWDARMCQLHGISPFEGAQPCALWSNCIHPEDREHCAKQLGDCLDGGGAFDAEFRVVHPGGAIRHLRATARFVNAAEGRAIRMCGVALDMTDTKLADERFRLAIDAAPTGMLLMDDTGKIVLANTQIEKIFGYARAELLGQQIENLIPQRFRADHPASRAGFFRTPKSRRMGAGRDLYGLRKDGSEVPVEIGLNPLRTSAGEFVLGSIVDQSPRRELDRVRADFVSTVSHELRTPLTSISGSLGLLQAGAMGALPAKADEMIRIAYRNTGRLVNIINDILDIGKIEAGQLTLHIASIPLAKLLQQTVEANGAFAQKCEVSFCLDAGSGEERVMADPDRLIQILTNLLSNAAKFSSPGGRVLIRLLPHPTTLQVEVEDFGPGIPEAFKSRIFEKFAQADSSTTRHFEGSGLGLSIARSLVEAMGGTIEYSSVMGSGSTFSIQLPRDSAARGAAP